MHVGKRKAAEELGGGAGVEVRVANINLLAARKNFRKNNMEMRMRNRKIVRRIRRRKSLYREKNLAKLKNRS